MSSETSAPTPYTPPGETFMGKAKRRTIEEPLVPIGKSCVILLLVITNYVKIDHVARCTIKLQHCKGALATVLAVTMATRQFKRGDRTSMNQWLRFRVAAQGFTILAICTYGFALRWRKKQEDAASVETNTSVNGPAVLTSTRGNSIVGDVQVTPAALQRQAAKEKEKEDFGKRLEEAIAKDRLEEAQKEKPDWKAAWKEGILRKNRENDAKRVKASDRME